MKKIICLLALAMLLGMGTHKLYAQKKGMNEVYFSTNMNCESCEKTLLEYLKFEKGVKNLKINHESNTIFIKYKVNRNNEDKLAKAIIKKGYKADKISKEEYGKLIKSAKASSVEHHKKVHKK